MSKARNIADIGSDDVISTSSTGIDVTGTVTADGLTVDSGVANQVATFSSTDAGAFVYIQDNNATGYYHGSSAGSYVIRDTDNKNKITATAGGDISFYEDTGTTPKMVWKSSDERLGLGTSSPDTALHVESSVSGASTTVASLVNPNSGVIGTGARLWLSGTNATSRGTYVEGKILNSGNGHALTFGTSASTAAPTETMSLTPANMAFPDLGATTTTIGVVDAANNYYNGTGRGSLILKASSALSGSQAQSGGRLILEAGNSHNGQSGQVYIRAGKNLVDNAKADIIFQQGLVESARFNAAGGFLVGKTSGGSISTNGMEFAQSYCMIARSTTGANPTMYLGANGTGGYLINFYKGGALVGAITSNGSSTTYGTSSDYRLKTDAQPMTGASARVQALNPVNFEWIADGTRVDGFLAHEAQAVVPEAVIGTKDGMMDEEYEVTAAIEATYDDDGNELTEAVDAVMGTRSVPDYQGIDQSKLVPLLTAALQEALTKIDDLETRLTALEA